MTLATETDPRETLRLILDDNATNSDYSNAGSKPGTIEVYESTQFRHKKQNQGDALYIWRPADADITKFGAAGVEKLESAVVQVEAWTNESAAQCESLAEDVQAIVQDYTNDSQGSTQWTDIFPTGEVEFRGQNLPSMADQYVLGVQVQLDRVAGL